ncbi:hypothetical protein, partial [Uliginosibacterium sp. TH139]|uniref:hypothetical protein n=1 Tax=Uliginosibacterium sp. TH139 TaxID=2067453 RepID=UPI001C1FCC20
MNTTIELEWSGLEIIKARRVAFRKLHLRMSHTTPNSLLCRKLHLPVDRLRPQRLILNRPGLPRHFVALNWRPSRGVYEQQAVHGRVQ